MSKPVIAAAQLGAEDLAATLNQIAAQLRAIRELPDNPPQFNHDALLATTQLLVERADDQLATLLKTLERG